MAADSGSSFKLAIHGTSTWQAGNDFLLNHSRRSKKKEKEKMGCNMRI